MSLSELSICNIKNYLCLEWKELNGTKFFRDWTNIFFICNKRSSEINHIAGKKMEILTDPSNLALHHSQVHVLYFHLGPVCVGIFTSVPISSVHLPYIHIQHGLHAVIGTAHLLYKRLNIYFISLLSGPPFVPLHDALASKRTFIIFSVFSIRQCQFFVPISSDVISL